jgi:hypothetical protein
MIADTARSGAAAAAVIAAAADTLLTACASFSLAIGRDPEVEACRQLAVDALDKVVKDGYEQLTKVSEDLVTKPNGADG